MCYLIKQFEDKELSAKYVRKLWFSCSKIKQNSTIPRKKRNYAFWENKKNSAIESTTYVAVITDINDINNNVTICIENTREDQPECYVLNRKLFDFNINVEDFVRITVINEPGSYCIKTQEYVKSQSCKDEEDDIIQKILASNDEDDF